MTQAGEIPGPFLLKSDANLFNHLLGKADVAVVVRGSASFRDEVAFAISNAGLPVWGCLCC